MKHQIIKQDNDIVLSKKEKEYIVTDLGNWGKTESFKTFEEADRYFKDLT